MTPPPDAFVVVLVTAGDLDTARRLARVLVEERLIACANIVGPIQSIYRWHGAVEEAAEQLLVLKARREDLATLTARIEALHPYDVPEILAIPLTDGAPRYLTWLADATDRAS
jgi:periplasmic divalent cation tolerance protein